MAKKEKTFQKSFDFLLKEEDSHIENLFKISMIGRKHFLASYLLLMGGFKKYKKSNNKNKLKELFPGASILSNCFPRVKNSEFLDEILAEFNQSFETNIQIKRIYDLKTLKNAITEHGLNIDSQIMQLYVDGLNETSYHIIDLKDIYNKFCEIEEIKIIIEHLTSVVVENEIDEKGIRGLFSDLFGDGKGKKQNLNQNTEVLSRLQEIMSNIEPQNTIDTFPLDILAEEEIDFIKNSSYNPEWKQWFREPSDFSNLKIKDCLKKIEKELKNKGFKSKNLELHNSELLQGFLYRIKKEVGNVDTEFFRNWMKIFTNIVSSWRSNFLEHYCYNRLKYLKKSQQILTNRQKEIDQVVLQYIEFQEKEQGIVNYRVYPRNIKGYEFYAEYLNDIKNYKYMSDEEKEEICKKAYNYAKDECGSRRTGNTTLFNFLYEENITGKDFDDLNEVLEIRENAFNYIESKLGGIDLNLNNQPIYFGVTGKSLPLMQLNFKKDKK